MHTRAQTAPMRSHRPTPYLRCILLVLSATSTQTSCPSSRTCESPLRRHRSNWRKARRQIRAFPRSQMRRARRCVMRSRPHSPPHPRHPPPRPLPCPPQFRGSGPPPRRARHPCLASEGARSRRSPRSPPRTSWRALVYPRRVRRSDRQTQGRRRVVLQPGERLVVKRRRHAADRPRVRVDCKGARVAPTRELDPDAVAATCCPGRT